MLGMRLFEAIAIALHVAEAQRIGHRLRQIDGRVFAVIEQRREGRR